MFGEGSLAYIKTIKAKKVSIVIGGHSMEKSGMLAKVEGYFKETGAETMVIRGVEPDPSFETVLRGRNEMLEFEPDLIVGLGGGWKIFFRRMNFRNYEVKQECVVFLQQVEQQVKFHVLS